MDQWEHEKLKGIDDIFKADDRNLMFCSNPDQAFENHYKMISDINLNEFVDDDVKVQFEISRNLFLYSFFYYRFSMPSFKQAAASAELGLRRYVGKPGNDKRKNTLKKLLRRAQSQGFISLKEINPHLEPEKFIETLISFRNSLAHGSHSLFPPTNCISFIKYYADILNTFYSYVRKNNIKPSLEGWE